MAVGGSQVNIVHITAIVCIAIGLVYPLINFRTHCQKVEAQMSIDRSKHKGNIANLHEQCQSQLDEHLTAKQESFQKQIDRMKEQYQP